MTPLDWIADALRYGSETLQLPDELEGADRLTLAEARSRLARISQVAGNLKRLVEGELAPMLAGGVLRYGEEVLKPSARGRVVVVDEPGWWEAVAEGVSRSDAPGDLLAALYPAGGVRLGALPKLAAALDVPADSLRSTFIDYADPSSPLDSLPRKRWYKWHHKLSDGQFSGEHEEA